MMQTPSPLLDVRVKETCSSDIKLFLLSNLENVRHVAPRLDIHDQIRPMVNHLLGVCLSIYGFPELLFLDSTWISQSPKDFLGHQ